MSKPPDEACLKEFNLDHLGYHPATSGDDCSSYRVDLERWTTAWRAAQRETARACELIALTMIDGFLTADEIRARFLTEEEP